MVRIWLCVAAMAGVMVMAYAADNDLAVVQVQKDQLKAHSADKGKVIIGSLADAKGHGHVVVVVPGSENVWDGNILGGFKDLSAGKKVSNNGVLEGMGRVIAHQAPK